MRVMYSMEGKPIGFVVDAGDTETYYALLTFFKGNGFDLDISYDSGRGVYYFVVKGISRYKKYQRFSSTPLCVKMPDKLAGEIESIAKMLGLPKSVVVRSLIFLGLNVLNAVYVDRRLIEEIDSKVMEKYVFGDKP